MTRPAKDVSWRYAPEHRFGSGLPLYQHADGHSAMQALKANPQCSPREMKVNANYISTFGQTALVDAVDMVYDVSGGRELTLVF